MFFRILKKDLKRKKTMNVVILLFVILSAMFASAAVNNIAAVTGGIDGYFKAANVPDALVTIRSENDAEERIRALPSVSEVKTQHYLIALSSKYFKLDGRKLDNFINPAMIMNDSEMSINYFDTDNNIIKGVDKGCFYANSPFLHDLDISVGDAVELSLGETTITLKYMGRFKGALFSSENTSNPFLILNSEDYDLLDKEDSAHLMNVKELYVTGTDISAIRDLAKDYEDIYVESQEDYKGIYLYDMISAYIMMAVSIVLMVTAFVVLRFTIGFTISEEFREIGVMKAVGIDNRSIRMLYIAKYLVISAAGSLVGFLGSIPLGDMMMRTISDNMVMDGGDSRVLGLISAAAVVALILLFCYGCTRRVKKLSPIDAVRNGQTGERFGRRSLLRLGRSRLPSTGFMALNDVLSAPKQFSIITVIFTLLMLMIMIMSNFALTLKSDKILWLFGVPSSDAHILDTEVMGELMADYRSYTARIEDTEKLLRDNGMPGTCTITMNIRSETTHGDKKAKIDYYVTKGHTEDALRMDEGYAPKKLDEIAVTASTLEELDAKIGDTLKAVIDGKDCEFIITGKYSGFTTRSAFLYKDFDFGDQSPIGFMGVQILFDGDPDKETIEQNVEKLRELTDSDKVYTTSDMIKSMTGMSDTLNSIKVMIMVLTVIVAALISVLMERSFISKEKSEIALMKAVGIRSGSIIAQHTLRFVIVSILSAGLSLAVLMPVSNWLMNWVCLMIGDVSGIKCDIDPLEIFVICPAMLIGVTLLGSFLTALYTRTIKASDTASIE